MSVREEVAEHDPDMVFADGFDEALVGMVERFGMAPVALYDRAKVIEILVADGLTEEEAEEHFSFNILGAYVGEHTPGFATFLERET